MSESAAQYISELEEILHSYTTIFLVFDIVFFVMLLTGMILFIHFTKSKKKLKESNEYLLFTIQGLEEERGRNFTTLWHRISVIASPCARIWMQKKSSSDSGFSFKISFPSPFYELQPCPT